MNLIYNAYCLQVYISNDPATDKKLKTVVDRVVCNENNLYDLGLGLNVEASTIEQIRTDRPFSIRMAGYHVVREWFNSNTQMTLAQKFTKLHEVLCEMGKESIAQELLHSQFSTISVT